jgi:hypothetical protein
MKRKVFLVAATAALALVAFVAVTLASPLGALPRRCLHAGRTTPST